MRRGLGFNLSGLYAPEARICGATSDARTFYHEGAGTILCWGETDLDLSLAFMVNGFRPAKMALVAGQDGRSVVRAAPDDTGGRRDRTVSDAVRAACL